MWRILLCGWLVMAVPAGAEDSPKESVKQGFKTAGKAVGHAAVEVGHGVRKGAKAVGHTVRNGAHAVGEGFKEGGRTVGHGVKHVVKGD